MRAFLQQLLEFFSLILRFALGVAVLLGLVIFTLLQRIHHVAGIDIRIKGTTSQHSPSNKAN
jgi:hypothetical protein